MEDFDKFILFAEKTLKELNNSEDIIDIKTDEVLASKGFDEPSFIFNKDGTIKIIIFGKERILLKNCSLIQMVRFFNSLFY